jgi:L,D-transpeptidase ErfK/SrfK
MYPEDMEMFYPMVPVGASVVILNQPIKVGWLGDELFIEVHPPLEEEQDQWDARERARELLKLESDKRPLVLDRAALEKALVREDGVPTRIGRAKTPGPPGSP